MRVGPPNLAASNQAGFALGQADDGHRASIEADEIGLQAVGKDHAVLGHVRAQHQTLARVELAGYQPGRLVVRQAQSDGLSP